MIVAPHQKVAAPRILSIAGTDPSGGAGIQADLKSIAANGGYGMAVVTALVAQNTQGVRSIHRPPVEFLTEQLDSVSDDVHIDAVKIGMLFDTETIAAVSEWLEHTNPSIIVLDPVMIAASGDRLLDESAEAALRSLLSAAHLVTPNTPELGALVEQPEATDWTTAEQQAKTLSTAHNVNVLLKGGHLDGAEAVDALITPSGNVTTFSAPRVETSNTHGTGCSLSSAIATIQARTDDWESTIAQAKAWLTESITAADDLHVGHGNGPISHFAGLWKRGGTGAPTAEQIASEWWDGIADIRAGIDALPFITRISEGTLAQEDFSWYLAQDALYLLDYSRVMAAASAIAPTPAEQAFWAMNAQGAIETELELHGTWLASDEMFAARPSKTTTAYTDHLLATAARGSYQELIAAVLPCFWIYVDAGTRLLPFATDDNPYALWLKTYGDEGFLDLNNRAISIVTEAAAKADPATRERMQRAFEVSAQHELDFFAAPITRHDE